MVATAWRLLGTPLLPQPRQTITHPTRRSKANARSQDPGVPGTPTPGSTGQQALCSQARPWTSSHRTSVVFPSAAASHPTQVLPRPYVKPEASPLLPSNPGLMHLTVRHASQSPLPKFRVSTPIPSLRSAALFASRRSPSTHTRLRVTLWQE